MFKYYTWINSEGYFKGHELLGSEQIRILLGHSGKRETFATIQDYDADGNCIGCPLYFDIDSPSLMEAFAEASILYYDLWSDYDVEPLFYFSGSKGFHIIVPLYIRHPRCHEIAKLIADEYPRTELDRSVYSQRRFWRCNGTWNEKGKSYKVRITDKESLPSMMGRAKKGEHLAFDPVTMKDMDISETVSRLPEVKKISITTGEYEPMMPCLNKLWNMVAPPDGERNYLCFTVSRWCYSSGLSEQQAIQLFDEHPFWKTVNPRDYEKVIASVYRSKRGTIGCEAGRDSELLKPHCTEICPYNNNLKGITIEEVFNVAKV